MWTIPCSLHAGREYMQLHYLACIFMLSLESGLLAPDVSAVMPTPMAIGALQLPYELTRQQHRQVLDQARNH